MPFDEKNEEFTLESLANMLGQVLAQYEMIKEKVQDQGVSWRTFKNAVMNQKGLDVNDM